MKVYPNRPQGPLAIDPREELSALGNTPLGLLLDLSLAPINGPALEHWPTAPQNPNIYVCFGGSVAPALNQNTGPALCQALP